MAGAVDRWDGEPVTCELSMTSTGDLTLTRRPGCTTEDAQQLCELVLTGYPVQDHTPPDNDSQAEAHPAA